jgi:hypothetical protein
MRILGIHVDVPEKRVLVPYKSLKLRRIQLYMGLPAITYSFNVAWGGGRG